MYKPGQWKAICDVCGFEYYSSEIQKRWDGLMVCKHDFEYDHPQKFLRVREDNISVPWVRSEPEDTFVHYCNIYAVYAYAGMGEAGCMQANKSSPLSYTQVVNLKAGI